MLSLPIAAGFAAAIVSTSFISGIFGMAGGMILIGILLAFMPLAPAMVLHGLVQIASNGWRAWQWRSHIDWRIVAHYAGGAVVAAAAVGVMALVASKAIALIIVGVSPLLGLLLPGRLTPDIERPSHAHGCGVLCTLLQLLAGVSGPILDVFFVRSQLNSRQLVATKAAVQVIGHFLKAAYFGHLLAGGEALSLIAIVVAIPLAVVGTHLSRFVLEVISETQFRAWSRYVIGAVSTIYLIQGVVLL
ncbi:TSUP family transporter [Bradyrhizobium sp. SRL28]|uniref:TSUP family transporter n=1 Tax=Bradyrhizobium sp. SRL28 TaxID=2836178 RepID=UPI001BDE5BF6|nr:TSUP family transporter [Bradyrhizobium sp. SRL28]MBT1509751.1 TSUP family transporter [Bradyrhizobium sp. SRL28]